MVTFSQANAAEFIDEDDELDEEPGEVIESAPPLKVGEERQINSSGLIKKLLKPGHGWETPLFNDEVTIHYMGNLLDGTKFVSTKDEETPFTFKLGHGQIVSGLDQGIITMTKGEISLFTLPAELGFGASIINGVPPNSVIQFEVELISWIRVLDLYKNGGIIKKIMEKGEQFGPPDELDEVLVKYTVRLIDGTIVSKTPEEGVEFYIKDGHFCQALPIAIKTMKRKEKVNLTVQSNYGFGIVGKDSTNDFPLIPPNSELNIDLELVSFKPVINITGDLKVLKKIVKEGEGIFVANEGATVTIKYTSKLENGTIIERKGFDGIEPLKFVTDEEQVISGLDRAIMTMKKGENAIITIAPEYGFGNVEVKMDLALIPANSTMVYEVEMLDFIREKAIWEMSNEERIEASSIKKEEGNKLFKNNEYERAAKKYKKAMDYINEEGPIFTESEDKMVKGLKVSCWLNSAACFLNLKHFHEVIKLCSEALDIEMCNIKGLYRRAQGYIGLANLELAELDIKKGLEIDPNNREMKLLKKNLKKLKVEENKRDAKLYSSMFSRMSKDSSKRMKIEKSEVNEMELEDESDSVATNEAMVVNDFC